MLFAAARPLALLLDATGALPAAGHNAASLEAHRPPKRGDLERPDTDPAAFARVSQG